MPARLVSAYLLIGLSVVGLSLLSVITGAMQLSLAELSGAFLSGSLPDDAETAVEVIRFVVMDIRLPRTVVALMVGASLAAAGVAMQGLFRNPLADPSLTGVTMGASLGAVTAIVLGGFFPAAIMSYLLPFGAFSGGVVATTVAYLIATRSGRSDTALLLLAGIAINAMAMAGIGLLSYFADDQQLRDLTLWQMGSVAKATWREIAITSPILLMAALLLLGFRKVLNALVMGESAAFHIGHNVKRVKYILLLLTTLIVSTAVAISGVIMFIGLVVPHVMRLLTGADHKHLLPLSLMCGGALLLLADIVSRLLLAPAEVPIGLIMSLFGGPFFVGLLLRQRRLL